MKKKEVAVAAAAGVGSVITEGFLATPVFGKPYYYFTLDGSANNYKA